MNTMSSDEHETLILSGLSRDDLETIKGWQLDAEHPITSREKAILATIDGALRGEAASRWGAFTEDELETLSEGISLRQFEWGGPAEPEDTLIVEIRTEIDRRREWERRLDASLPDVQPGVLRAQIDKHERKWRGEA